MTSLTKKLLLVGGTLVVLTWSGLRVYTARSLEAVNSRIANSEQSVLESFRPTLEKLPAYKLTFLGARLLRGSDYDLAKMALELATEKDRFYRDAFRYYGYVLQATGEHEKAELALRRAKTLDPRILDCPSLALH